MHRQSSIPFNQSGIGVRAIKMCIRDSLLNVESDALMASLQEILKLSNEQLTAFTADFEARLPEYLRNALHPKSVAA